eukprot:14602446-Alexandrium_andersonii.AAC.1
MSASLVGSEMCIRDSRWRTPPAFCCRTSWGSRSARQLGGRPLCRSVRAVSYTHLTLPTICSV